MKFLWLFDINIKSIEKNQIKDKLNVIIKSEDGERNMEEIKLIEPTLAYADDIMMFRSELFEANDASSFAGCGNLRQCSSAEEWINSIYKMGSIETCPEGYVPSSTYLAVRTSDNRIIGVIDLRHHINHPVLGLWGGHIGYIVRPKERNKGYAREMLRQSLKNCKARGIDKVLVTCNHDNHASERTIIANGGVFENEVFVDGKYIKRYWITLM